MCMTRDRPRISVIAHVFYIVRESDCIWSNYWARLWKKNAFDWLIDWSLPYWFCWWRNEEAQIALACDSQARKPYPLFKVRCKSWFLLVAEILSRGKNKRLICKRGKWSGNSRDLIQLLEISLKTYAPNKICNWGEKVLFMPLHKTLTLILGVFFFGIYLFFKDERIKSVLVCEAQYHSAGIYASKFV